MLAVTQSAAEAIRDMLANSGLGDDGGLRISAQSNNGTGEAELQLEFTPAALPDDEVVAEHGVQVFLDPPAAAALSEMVLDGELHGDHIHFSLDEQDGDGQDGDEQDGDGED